MRGNTLGFRLLRRNPLRQALFRGDPLTFGPFRGQSFLRGDLDDRSPHAGQFRGFFFGTSQETTNLGQAPAGRLAAGLVGFADLDAVVFHAADIDFAVGPDDKRVLARLPLADVGHLLVVHDMAVLESFDGLGIVLEGPAHHAHHLGGMLCIAGGTGQDDDIALIALLLHEPQRDGIRDPAVQQLIAAQLDHAGDHGHGTGRPEPLQHLIVAVIVAQVIDRFAGLDIRAHQIKLHRILPEGFPVKRIQLLGNLVIAELRIKEVARRQERPHAGITGVLRILQIVADRPARLPRFIIAAEGRPSGNTDSAVKLDSFLHQDIQSPCGKNPANTAAFQYQPCFHLYLHIPAYCPLLSY